MSPTEERGRARRTPVGQGSNRDILEAFRRYYSAEINFAGDLVLICAVCRVQEVIERALLGDAGHLLGRLNHAHKVHGPHAQVRR